MFGMGMPEIIVILVIALIVIGPKKLPELAKALGKGMSEFKKATQEIKGSLNVQEDFKEVKNDLVDSVTGLEKIEPVDESEKTEEKQPKFKDFDEMVADYAKDDHSKEGESVGEESVKSQQEKAPEKDSDGK